MATMTKEMRDYRKAVREAVAAYVRSEGCSCCSDYDAHREAAAKLGALIGAKKYSDGSGYDLRGGV